MTKREIHYRNILLKEIHSHRVYNSLKDEEWRDFLHKNYRVTSSKLLGISELKNLILLLDGKINRALNDTNARREIKNYLTQIESNTKERATPSQIEKIQKIRRKQNLTNRKFWEFVDTKIGYFPFRLNLIQKLEANKIIMGLLK